MPWSAACAVQDLGQGGYGALRLRGQGEQPQEAAFGTILSGVLTEQVPDKWISCGAPDEDGSVCREVFPIELERPRGAWRQKGEQGFWVASQGLNEREVLLTA
jgi:hypothetical protein